MPASIEDRIASVKEDRRADHLWDVKVAARVMGVSETKFSDWWYRTRGKLLDLFRVCPGETAAELMTICAQGAAQLEDRKDRRLQNAK